MDTMSIAKQIGYIGLGIVMLRLIALVLQPVGDLTCNLLAPMCEAEPIGWFWTAFISFIALAVIFMGGLVAYMLGRVVDDEVEDRISAFKHWRNRRK